MNYWQNKKQGHTTPGTPTHPMLCTPHECPNQQTPQQNFSELQDHTKNMTSIRSKNIYGINPAHQHPTQKRGWPVHCHNIPFHQYTSSQHNTQTCCVLKRIEQSTLLSSQTTHHTNNTTTHKHACSTIISRSVISPLHFERQPIQLYSLPERNTS